MAPPFHLSSEQIQILSSEIKKKKNLKGLSDSLIHNEIDQFFKRNPQILEDLSTKNTRDFSRSSLFKKALKEIRSILHQSYGVFNPEGKQKQLKILNELKSSKNKLDKKIHEKILKTNISTRERINSYDKLYENLFEITGKPLSILDLSAGLNPLSFPWMGLKNVFYTSTEINENDKILLNKYFEIMVSEGLEGKAITLNLLQGDSLKELEQISNVDITFMLKLVESISFKKKSKYKKIESLLKAIKSRWIVVSFATKTISGKKMKSEKRGWFELMVKRIGLNFNKIETYNEVFYVLKNR